MKWIQFNLYIAIFGLFIIMVVSANLALVYFAHSSNPGLVNDNYYNNGIRYGDKIRQQKKQSESGINAILDLEVNKEISILGFKIYDRENRSINSEELKIDVHIYRPSNKKNDHFYNVGLKNNYTFFHRFEFPGKWTVSFDIYDSGELIFSGNKKIFIPK